MQVLSSAFLGLVFTTGRRVLCSRRPTRRRILHSLGWGPRQALGVPLPLVVAPQGMPHQPCLCVLVVRDTQLHAEPPVWLSCIILGGGRWHACAISLFLTGPLTTGWALCYTSCWGAMPFGLAGGGGLPSVPHCLWAAAPYNLLLTMAAPRQ
jgi:hypothetical protein